MTNEEHVALGWDGGRARVLRAGAMLHDLVFRLGGREVAPLAEAPWHDDDDIQRDETIPKHLRLLGGEWPCIPFGSTEVDPDHHGYGTDHLWTMTEDGPGSVSLAIDYPPGHPVKRLSRRISGIPGRAAIAFSLTVEARSDCAVPLGLHPIFRVPPTPGALRLDPGPFAQGFVFAPTFEPGVSQLLPGGRFDALDRVPLTSGGAVDVSRQPAGLREELVQLAGTQGRFRIENREDRYAAILHWKAEDFPSCLIWLSHGGRQAPPWNGVFHGIGIEPVAAFFDRQGPGVLGVPEDMPVKTARRFRASEIWSTDYRLEVAPL